MPRASSDSPFGDIDFDALTTLCEELFQRITDAGSAVAIVSPPIDGRVYVAYGDADPDSGQCDTADLPGHARATRSSIIGAICNNSGLTVVAHRCPVCFARDAAGVWPKLADWLAHLTALDHHETMPSGSLH